MYFWTGKKEALMSFLFCLSLMQNLTWTWGDWIYSGTTCLWAFYPKLLVGVWKTHISSSVRGNPPSPNPGAALLSSSFTTLHKAYFHRQCFPQAQYNCLRKQLQWGFELLGISSRTRNATSLLEKTHLNVLWGQGILPSKKEQEDIWIQGS